MCAGPLGRNPVLKSKHVCPEGPRGIRAGRETASLSAEVARQFQYAQFHERDCVRRHAAGGGWEHGDRNARAAGTAPGGDGGLVPAEELSGEGCWLTD